MTSKNSFWKLSIWNFKKRAWTFALCAVIWFFVLPVAIFINAQQMLEAHSTTIATDMEWIQYILINSHISGSGFYGFIAIVMAMFLGIHGYAWNNHQQKVDMYKAVPVKASSRFWYINLNSLWMFTITFGGSLIAGNLIMAVYGVWSMNFLSASLLSFIMHLLLFMATYCIVILAQYLTGNIVLGVMGSTILILIEPACYHLREGMKVLFYDTHAGNDSYIVIEEGVFTPLAPYIKAYKSVSVQKDAFADTVNYGDVWLPLVLLAVQIIIYGSIAYILYQKRPAQTGGKAMIFPKTKPVIKCVLMVVGSLYFAVIMISFTSERMIGYGIFGVICGLLIIHVILQSIMNGGFKEALKGKVGFCVATVLTFVIYLGYVFDVTGYDTYLPKADEVESIAFVRDGDYVYDMYNEQGSYVSTRDYFKEHMAITDTASKEALLTMLQTAIDHDDYCTWDDDMFIVTSAGEISASEMARTTDTSPISPTYEDGNDQERVYVKFRLTNGKEVERSYILRLNDIRNYWAGLYDLPEYKELAYMLLRDELKEEMEKETVYGSVTYHVYGTSLNDYGSRSDELMKQFYEALCEDISERSAETVLNNAPIGQFGLHIEDEYKNSIFRMEIPVYESDANTVVLLKEQGWYQQPGIEADKVVSMTVSQDIDAGMDYKILEIPTDAPYFKEVVECMITNEAFTYVIDAGAVVKDGYWAEVNVLIDGLTHTYSCRLDKSKFPEELEKVFEDVIPESEKAYEDVVVYETVNKY